MHLIRLTNHPAHPDLAVMHTPPELAGAVGTFQAARYAPDLRAYLIDTSPTIIEGLYRWARHHNARVIDDRTIRGGDGPRLLPVECRNCATPVKATAQPDYCPACGRIFEPHSLPPGDAGRGVTRHLCTACGATQTSRHPFCQKCGGPIAFEKHPIPVRLADRLAAARRQRLDDPQGLGDMLDEFNPRPGDDQ